MKRQRINWNAPDVQEVIGLLRTGVISADQAFSRISPIICSQRGSTLSFKGFKRQMQHELSHIRPKKIFKVYDWEEPNTVAAMIQYLNEGKRTINSRFRNLNDLARAISGFQMQEVSNQRISDRLKVVAETVACKLPEAFLDPRTTDSGVPNIAEIQTCSANTQEMMRREQEGEEESVELYNDNTNTESRNSFVHSPSRFQCINSFDGGMNICSSHFSLYEI